MALDKQFLKLMPDRVVVSHWSATSTDGYGVRTYATASTFQCRIEQKVQIVKGPQDRDTVSMTTIYTPTVDVNGTAATIGISDKVTLPSTYGTRLTPPIIWVERHNDATGPMYQKVYV
jgi:hypothetical protein